MLKKFISVKMLVNTSLSDETHFKDSYGFDSQVFFSLSTDYSELVRYIALKIRSKSCIVFTSRLCTS